MALMYPWATREYCLWEMSIGQLLYYHNEGIRQKYPSQKSESESKSIADNGREGVLKKREELRALFGDIGSGDDG